MLRLSRLSSHHLQPFPSRAIRRFQSTTMAITDTTERLASLRKLMKERAIDLYSAYPTVAAYATVSADG